MRHNTYSIRILLKHQKMCKLYCRTLQTDINSDNGPGGATSIISLAHELWMHCHFFNRTPELGTFCYLNVHYWCDTAKQCHVFMGVYCAMYLKTESRMKKYVVYCVTITYPSWATSAVCKLQILLNQLTTIFTDCLGALICVWHSYDTLTLCSNSRAWFAIYISETAVNVITIINFAVLNVF